MDVNKVLVHEAANPNTNWSIHRLLPFKPLAQMNFDQIKANSITDQITAYINKLAKKTEAY